MIAKESSAPDHLFPALLAKSLAEGALREVELTPKPGLVDRHDSGSHRDLTFEGMRTSAGLLPLYYDEILRCCHQGSPLEDFVQAGIEAEGRMTREIHSNAHKGYIFLSGLVLMAAWEWDGRIPALRKGIADTATRFFAHFEALDSHGAEIRHRHALGGIRLEAEAGLPAVFEYGWPAYRKALGWGWEPERAGHYLMALLMQQVEDTTSIRRCGLEGLARLKKDGAYLQGLLEQGQSATLLLSHLNEEYRQINLTMGGVADCIALTFALEKVSRLQAPSAQAFASASKCSPRTSKFLN